MNNLNKKINIPKSTTVTITEGTKRINLPKNITVALEESISNPNAKSILIPLPTNIDTSSRPEQDPLFIPEIQRGIDYSELYSHLMRVPKLPASTTVSVNKSETSSQKENIQNRNSQTSKSVPDTVILHDDENEGVISKMPKLSLLGHMTNNKTQVSVTNSSKKRKREPPSPLSKDDVIKKMKSQFNNTLEQIDLDDDDDVTDITDTTSENGSLSNEILRNLGLSGVTVHKVIKDTADDNVITLD
ncbi:hypothetical protein NQ317_007226 [Molorchus minor]|uniref:Uncharacterized protein n=1 Tax=Molorchus minor TaxID=1323400 RepID=A0ABQ9J168_9CUCU|nr:hypothetical protein NQ317_007226 [Molorchus minor]